MPDKSDLAGRIRELRKKAGLKQDELAEAIGVHLITISRWENGGDVPKTLKLQRLASALHVTEAELLNGPGEMNWELKLIFREEGEVKGGTIDMSGSTITTALTVGDAAISLELGGPIELWEDDAKFELFIDQLRKRRAAGLKMRKEGW